MTRLKQQVMMSYLMHQPLAHPNQYPPGPRFIIVTIIIIVIDIIFIARYQKKGTAKLLLPSILVSTRRKPMTHLVLPGMCHGRRI